MDIRFVKERYETRMAISGRNWTLAVMVLCVMVLSLFTALVMTRMSHMRRERRLAEAKLKAEKDEYEGMYNAALAEISELNEAFGSSAIRRKLGLSEHDTNLDIFLRKKLSESRL